MNKNKYINQIESGQITFLRSVTWHKILGQIKELEKTIYF